MGLTISRTNRTRRMSGRASVNSEVLDQGSNSEGETDPDIATILQYLIRRYLNRRRSGQIRVIGSESDSLSGDYSDEDSFLPNTPPRADPNPDTSCIQDSDLYQSVLLQSGDLGELACSKPHKVPLFLTMIQKREVAVRNHDHFSTGDCCLFNLRLLPNKMKIVDKYHSKAFCGMFTKNGDSFMSASQDGNIRIYDTSTGYFKLKKVVPAQDVGWSILDTAVSPDGQHFIYSSWSEYIHICNIHGEYETHEALVLSPEDRRFCIFSLRFSQDGREILGGANDECIYVYDRDLNKRSLKIRSHEDDVNSVAFADSTSHILFSGGDDGLCKVWDRRTLNEDCPRPVGILAGHIDGITYIDPKGDGRHLITNSKDQTIKLWDMRAFSSQESAKAARTIVSSQNWDYRWQRIPKKLSNQQKKVAGDTSLMTYRGHSVLQTLIRCHFSPEISTGQRLIYTGCATGRIIVYDVLTGKIVKVLCGHLGCVRDVSWHPYRQQLISSSWDGTLGCWTYSGKQSLDSDEEEIHRADQLSLRRSPRIAQLMIKPQAC